MRTGAESRTPVPASSVNSCLQRKAALAQSLQVIIESSIPAPRRVKWPGLTMLRKTRCGAKEALSVLSLFFLIIRTKKFSRWSPSKEVFFSLLFFHMKEYFYLDIYRVEVSDLFLSYFE